ncbi:MAG TPA: YkgJ family cysteine cluster protein [Spirochaetota bacterium]|nr:YkgJ family cysteine cluster protein [Spirochaetota bacterium]
MEANFSFTCSRCGSCCREHGFVFFSDNEVDICAKHVGLYRYEFIDRFLTSTFRGFAHEVSSGGQCIFLESGGCVLHDVKPEQCRSFPFWHEYIGESGELVNFNRHCEGKFRLLKD